ncbi:MAG: ketopantoate reductase C-terminal domain-containing protein [Candidatus Lustribacter sp.]|jgi:2-dehydropantoate 2-reductase
MAVHYSVIGAGAVGTLLAVTLARNGNDAVLISRGEPGKKPLRRRVQIEHATREHPERVHFSVLHDDEQAAAGGVTVLCVQAHDIAAAVTEHASLFGPLRTVVAIQAGIPWWYFSHSPVHVNRPIVAVDPDGRIGRTISSAEVVGGVLETATVVHRPGLVHANAVVRLHLGEIDNVPKPRTADLAAAFTAGLVQATTTTQIRTAIWRKLVTDIAIQPMSALTRATPAEMCADPIVRGKLAHVMREAMTLAASFDVMPDATAESHLEQLSRSKHLTTMLRDALVNRPLEIDALTGAALELAKLNDVAVGSILELDALTRLLDRSLRTPRDLGENSPAALR